MKKVLFSGLLLLSTTFAFAQQSVIATQHTNIFAEINLPHLFYNFSPEHLNQSATGKSMFQTLLMMSKNHDEMQPVQHSGVDFKSEKAYWYMVSTDSVDYDIAVIPVSDKEKFRKYIGFENQIGAPHFDGTAYKNEDEKLVFLPKKSNNAILINYKRNYKFFDDTTALLRYGIAPVKYDYNDADVTVVDTASYDAAEAVAVAAAEAASEVENASEKKSASKSQKESKKKSKKKSKKAAQKEPQVEVVELSDTTVEETLEDATAAEDTDNSYYDSVYYKDRERFNAQTDSLMTIWATAFVEKMMQQNYTVSDLKNTMNHLEEPATSNGITVYLRSSFWPSNSWTSFFGLVGKDTAVPNDPDKWSAYGIDFEPNKIVATSVTQMSDAATESYKKINKRKINPKFSKYINSNTDIGLMSFAYNTENYLQEMPNFVKEYLSKNEDDEIALLADMYSILLDEKAVGKVIWGDGLLVFTEMKEKTYKTIKYIYDDDTYENTADTVMKTEMLPNFLFMFTSKDNGIIKRSLDYLVRKKRLLLDNGIYAYFDSARYYDPIDFFCTVKDDIVFMATDKEALVNIQNDTYPGNISAEDKKMLKRNTAGWFKPSRLSGKITEEDALKKLKINKALSNTGDILFYSEKVKDNKARVIGTMSTSGKMRNSFEYLLYLMDDFKTVW